MPAPRERRIPVLATVVLASLLAHGIGWALLAWVLPRWRPEPVEEPPLQVRILEGEDLAAFDRSTSRPVEDLTREVVPLPEEVKPPEPPKPPPIDGQVVEVAKAFPDTPPPQAEYLAKFNQTVPEESRSERYKVNPQVLSPTYSRENKLALENAPDVGAQEWSSGATVGTPSQQDKGKGAPTSAVPSPWSVTNKEGLAAPVPASSMSQLLSGAPQNDRLREKKGDMTALNTREFVGADYLNRIKRQVNFYWQQNLDNLSPSAPLVRPEYTTEIAIVLSKEGALEEISVTTSSGSEALDLAVVNAYKLAAPFPHPPEQLLDAEGKVRLDRMAWTVTVGRGGISYTGIDPRAGVQFPGIMKNIP